MTAPRPAIVAHPAGGYTLAVPAGDGSTVRYYQGWWRRRPRRIRSPRAATQRPPRP
jgi:hypothetical protein